jgi:ABC-type antimicrobial peptide transport system permease subunit
MARRYWPDENPLGKRLKSHAEGSWRMVVGVVGNVKRFALEDQSAAEFYIPLLQPIEESGGKPETQASAGANPMASAKAGEKEKPGKSAESDEDSMSMVMSSTANQRLASYISLVVGATGRPEALADAVQKTVWSLDRDQPILKLGTMQARLDEVYAPRRFNMLLFGVFALVALVLAAAGLYGTLAYMVAQRTHEIGIRLALGAQTRGVLWLIIRQGLALTLIGVALGLGAALALTRVLQNLLYEVSATDPATFAGIALLLISVAFIACYIPARRATKVDPLVALRHE